MVQQIYLQMFVYLFVLLRWVPWCPGAKTLSEDSLILISHALFHVFYRFPMLWHILCLRAFCFTVSGVASVFLGKLRSREGVSPFSDGGSLPSELHLHTLQLFSGSSTCVGSLCLGCSFTSTCRHAAAFLLYCLWSLAWPPHHIAPRRCHSWLPAPTVLRVRPTRCDVTFPDPALPPKLNPSGAEPGLTRISGPCCPSCRSVSHEWVTQSADWCSLSFPFRAFFSSIGKKNLETKWTQFLFWKPLGRSNPRLRPQRQSDCVKLPRSGITGGTRRCPGTCCVSAHVPRELEAHSCHIVSRDH